MTQNPTYPLEPASKIGARIEQRVALIVGRARGGIYVGLPPHPANPQEIAEADEQLRQTTFLGWRDDKVPKDILSRGRSKPTDSRSTLVYERQPIPAAGE